MEYSTHVFVQQSPITDQSFEAKLQDISDEITTHGCLCPNVFSLLTNLAVQQAVVSSTHIAFLLEDGRICRVSFRVQADKINFHSTEPVKPKSKHLAPQPIRPSISRSSFENLILSSSNPSIAAAVNNNVPVDLLPQFHSGYPLHRQRHQLIRAARGRAGIIFGSRPVIPSSSVPEELIEQVQVVLQGKSRNVILRELQRTNLDVNMAVNNLLARDGDGDDDIDDEYIGADLISLLDVSPHNEHSGIILEPEIFDETEVTLRYGNNQRRVVSARIANNPSTVVTGDQSSSVVTSSSLPTDRDRKRTRYDPRWLDGSLREELFNRINHELKPDDLSIYKDSSTKTNSSIRKDQHSASTINAPTNPILFSEQLQFWTDSNSENTYPRFTHIACLHSELIAINTNGQLCQWNWHDDYPYQDLDNPQLKHPKTLSLQLFNEKIVNLSANLIRASVLTETNCIATWIDELLGTQVSLKLQHPAQEFLSMSRILDIQTTPLYTVFRTDANELYWYGILPDKPRKKLLERLKEKTCHKPRTNPQQQQLITVGCSVCLISNPYYNQGAWAFYIRDGQPKLGQLMEQAWLLSNTARFRIKTIELVTNKNKEDDRSSLEMPPPPSPASSTCSVDSNTSFVTTLKRKRHSIGSNPFLPNVNDNDSNEQHHSKIKDEEYWPLDEVIFIEDCKVAPIGKVMKIDGSLVLVKFPTKNDDTNPDANNLDNCRILRKDDLQVVKGNQVPKTPDCTLSLANAKRIALENGTLLTYSIDKHYLHTLQIRDTNVHYIMYEVGSNHGLCRSTRQTILPLINNRQSLATFTGENPHLIRLCTLNSPDIPRLLIDSNRLIYPFISNQDKINFKDPQWKNLFGINYFSQGIIPLKTTDLPTKTHLVLNIMQMQKGILIPHILRYDIEKIRSILNEIERNQRQDLLKLILDERIDGCRNLFHACVRIGIPLTNKEYLINDEQIQNEKRLSFATDLPSSQPNVDHNYGSTLRSNPPGNLPEWPPSTTNESSISFDAQPLSSSTTSLDSTSNLYRASSTSATTDTVSPSTLSLKNSYLENSTVSQNYQFGRIVTSVSSNHSTRVNPNEFTVWSACKYDEREKRLRAIQILRLLLDCSLLQDHLFSLLSFCNLQGQTPFMSAVHSHAYHTASILFEYSLKISKQQRSSSLEQNQNQLLQMIYPSTSIHGDYSPLYILCTNDTCSFTWTGEEHISQAIFECKTCGLSGTLCCCSECAQTCHKGHDCRLKRTSPTAYCDCWEVCKCKSLIAGDQQKRLELFKLLLNETNLVQMKNSRDENLLLYLVQTVGRQVIEQQQFTRTSTAAIIQRKTREQLINHSSTLVAGSKKLSHQISSSGTINPTEYESNIPDHHLEPPQFCRRALELILADWSGVKSMLLSGCLENLDPTIDNMKQSTFLPSSSPPSMSAYNNDNIFSLDEQQQTSQLDRFTYFLLVKCNTVKQTNSTTSKSTTTNDLLDILLETLIREMSNPTHRDLVRYVTARFVRSVIRLFIILSLQSTTIKRSSSTHTGPQSILFQCKRVLSNVNNDID